MEFIPEAIDNYVKEHSDQESELLQKINRETYARVMMPRMLSGHVQGRVLSMLSHMMKPEVIVEVGTYTGYSALCMAEGMAENGKLITLDINEELEDQVRGYFDESPYSNQIDYRIGNAMELLPEIDEPIDLVFIDADKKNYLNYLELLLPKIKTGGVLLSDNVLWSGKVLEETQKNDRDTTVLKEFNQKLAQHPQLETVMLPLRDGLTLSRKI